MLQIGTLLLANVFAALLPPVDPDEVDFYEILGVESNATDAQIRKAYKSKSLKLHPDKVAQRRDYSNKEEAAAEYEKVQEAYSVLVNEEKRQRYQALGNAPSRYRFVAQGALSNPGALYENLTGASFVDKTRLVVFCSMMVMIVLMQPILIATKVNHLLEERGALENTKWTVIFIPFWMIGAAVICFWSLLLALVPTIPAKVAILLTVLEQLAWYLAVLFLSLKWDGAGAWESSTYRQVLTPVYIAMVLQWMQALMVLQKIRHDIQRMVTVDYLEKEVLKGKSLEDLTEDERENLRKEFLVVTVPPDFEPTIIEEELEEDDGVVVVNTEAADEAKKQLLEEQKVEASPEYEAATDIYNSTYGGFVGSFVFGLVFLIVLTQQLDRKIDASWWAVFTPLWIYFGSRWIYSFLGCMCGAVTGEEVIIQMQQQQQEQEDGDGDDDNVEDGEKKDKDKKEDKRDDSNFLNPETNVSDFLASESERKEKENDRPDDEKDADKKQTEGKQQEEEKKKDTLEMPTTDETKPTSSSTEENGSEKVEETTTTDNGNGDDQKDQVKNDDEMDEEAFKDEDDHIHIDEETFKAWQNAYEEAEKGAMEQQAKASMECCNVSIKLLLLCLVVAKIEQNFDKDNDPEDVGFNTFWILFPFLLFFGLVFCCCACLIYGAAPGTAADLYGTGEANGESNGEHPDVENPAASSNDNDIFIAEPPSVDESAVDTAASGASTTTGGGSTTTGAASTTTGPASASNASTAESELYTNASESVANETVESDVFKGMESKESSMEDLD